MLFMLVQPNQNDKPSKIAKTCNSQIPEDLGASTMENVRVSAAENTITESKNKIDFFIVLRIGIFLEIFGAVRS